MKRQSAFFAAAILAALLVPNATLAQAAKVIDISARGFSMQLRVDGTVWAWGRNDTGNLSDYITEAARSAPVQVRGLSNIVAISAGADFGLALDANGQVFAWGSNTYGQLGNGSTDIFGQVDYPVASANLRINPRPVTGLSDITAIAAGSTHALALRSDGTVWAWGNNGAGQLGNGTTAHSSVPVLATGASDVAVIAAGGSYSIALTGDGQLLAWGSDIGTGVPGAGSMVPSVLNTITDVVSVAAGEDRTLAVKRDGTVWGWGVPFGSGLISSGARPVAPAQVPGVTDVVRVSVGGSAFTTGPSALALRADGTVFHWGGQPGVYLSALPPDVTSISSSPIKAIAAGAGFTLALDETGRVFARGDNASPVGAGETLSSRIPLLANAPVPPAFTETVLNSVETVGASSAGSMAVARDGTVWAWGGDGIHYPTKIDGLFGPIAAVSGKGYDWVGVVREGSLSGRVFTWTNSPGNLTGLIEHRLPRFQRAFAVQPLRDVIAVAQGRPYFIALDTSGRVQKYRGFPSDAGFDDAAAIAAGDYHFLVLRKDGSVWTFGTNDRGQLGDGTLADSPDTAVPVVGLTNVKAIAAGDCYSIAVDNDGSVFVWGLPPGWGDESTRCYSTSDPSGYVLPVRIAGLADVKQIAADRHVLALTLTGLGYVWGRGSKAGPEDAGVLRRAPWMDGLVSVAAGTSHSLGATADGHVVAWGDNDAALLGLERPAFYDTWREVVDPLDDAYTRNAVALVEFFNSAAGPTGDHFVTPSVTEAAALDLDLANGWQRTGRSTRAWLAAADAPSEPIVPAYRFSRDYRRFYTIDEDEKSDLASLNPTQDPAVGWVFEGVAFHVLPATSDCPSVVVSPYSPLLCQEAPPSDVDCPYSYYPVYRAVDQHLDHDLTSNWIDIYESVRYFGYEYEGVAWCSPASRRPGGDLHASNTYPGAVVDAGAPLSIEYWFNNAGPGDADGARIIAALPRSVTWNVSCRAYHAAQCPLDLEAGSLRGGVNVPVLPAGGLLQLTATGQAPVTPDTLEFQSLIGEPTGAPDPYTPNNASPVFRTEVRSISNAARK